VFTIRTRPRWQSRAASPPPGRLEVAVSCSPAPLRLEVAVSCVPAREVAVLGRNWPKNRTKLPPRPQNRTELPPRHNKPGPKHPRRLEVAVSCGPAREVAVLGRNWPKNRTELPPRQKSCTRLPPRRQNHTKLPPRPGNCSGLPPPPPPPGNRSQDCAGASSEPASSSYSACSWASSDSVEDANLVERKAL
jgi:hypothetical protein